jgi:hypothetical protein
MQLDMVYFPMFYKDQGLRENIEGMTWYSPMLEKHIYGWTDESIDKHFMELADDHQKLAYPILAWTSVGICGFGYDQFAGPLAWEMNYLGSSDLFHDKEEIIYKIAMPHFRKHPKAKEKRVRKYREQRVPLSRLREPLSLNLPIVWSCWYDYDEYSGEADAEFWPIGELNTVRLDTILIGGGHE